MEDILNYINKFTFNKDPSKLKRIKWKKVFLTLEI